MDHAALRCQHPMATKSGQVMVLAGPAHPSSQVLQKPYQQVDGSTSVLDRHCPLQAIVPPAGPLPPLRQQGVHQRMWCWAQPCQASSGGWPIMGHPSEPCCCSSSGFSSTRARSEQARPFSVAARSSKWQVVRGCWWGKRSPSSSPCELPLHRETRSNTGVEPGTCRLHSALTPQNGRDPY
jgi:hypothetical protein